jgi:hypothetical protein
MKEEYERLVAAELAYRNHIKGLPQGSPRVKRIRNHDYLYLARRDGPKVVYDYIGPADSGQAQEALEKIERRKRYEALLKDIHNSLKEVRKVLRGKI